MTGLLATHWGTYRHTGADGALSPVAEDPDPASFGLHLTSDRLAPCRVLTPAVRRSFLERGARGRRGAEPFVEVTWDQALDLAAAEIQRVRTDYGAEALYTGSYGWSSAGRFHHAQSQLKRFYNLGGGSVRSVQSYSYAAAEVLLPHVLGSTRGLINGHTPWELLAGHAELIVMFGGTPLRNSQVSAGGIVSHGTRAGLLACRDQGAHFVNISPVRDDAMADLQADWLALRPNTDTALLLALCHVLLTEDHHDRAFLARYTVGFEPFRDYVLGTQDGTPKTPAWAAAITGLAAGTIVALARRMAAQRTFLMMAWSLQRADHGEQPYWAAIALACLLGGIGLPGGGFGFGYACLGGIGVAPPAITWPSLPQARNPVDAFIPVARIADMLLDPGGAYDHDGVRRRYPDIKLIHWAGGNPFHHAQDLNRLVEAWQRPQTIIAHEHWWNAHARHADIVLPAATFFERDDVAASGREHFIAFSSRTADPPAGVMTDHDIFVQLAARLGFADAFTEGLSTEAWLRRLYDAARSSAGGKRHRAPGSSRSSAAPGSSASQPPTTVNSLPRRFPRRPGAPRARHPLRPHRTLLRPHRQLRLRRLPRPPRLARARRMARRPARRPHTRSISSRRSRTTSCTASGTTPIRPARPSRAVPSRSSLTRPTSLPDISPTATSSRSSAPAAGVWPRLRPMTASSPAWSNSPPAPGSTRRIRRVPGSLERNGNPNVLTPDHGTSRLAQGPSPNSCLVEIRKFDGPPPAIGAYLPPIAREACENHRSG